MYPEGWLMDPEGKSLLYFEKDPMNPMYEGYVGSWLISGDGFKQFRYRKRISKAQALAQWTHLSNQGWSLVRENEQAA